MNLTELYAKADYQDEMGMLFHGDCMNLLKEIDDNCVDLVLTDPHIYAIIHGMIARADFQRRLPTMKTILRMRV